jgi:alpha-beta hydrolase superfamily lysophospholipase
VLFVQHEVLKLESKTWIETKSYLHWWKNSIDNTKPSKGYVWITHGIGEHACRYQEMAAYLNNFGFDVLGLDLPGHGLSAAQGGQRDLASFDEMVAELNSAKEFWLGHGPMSAQGAKQASYFLFGHSMGALITLYWMLEDGGTRVMSEFATRAFVSAPPLALKLPVPEWKKALAHKLNGVLPNLRMTNEIATHQLSYDIVNQRNYKTDELVHPYASPRLYTSMLSAAAQVIESSQSVEIPLCLSIGADDPIVDAAALRAYFESLGTHKKFLTFSNMKHEAFNEINRRECYEALIAWFG